MENTFRTNYREILSSLLCDEFSQVFHVTKTMKMVYYTYFHSINNYEIIFLRNSPYTVEVFKIQRIQLKLLSDAAAVAHVEDVEIYLRP